jgi:hypothetical protein
VASPAAPEAVSSELAESRVVSIGVAIASPSLPLDTSAGVA